MPQPAPFDKLPDVLASWRRATGESRLEVARLAGVSTSSIERYESGTRPPRLDELSRLLAHFGRDLYGLADELIAAQGGTPREEPVPAVAIHASADEYPGATREQVAELLALRRRLYYYEEQRQRAAEEISALRVVLRSFRG